MKGIYGLLLAIALGVAGAMFNYAYLASKLPDVDTVGFVGIKDGVDVARGDRLAEEHVVRVNIPRHYVGNLKDVAVPYSVVDSVMGSRVWRPLPGGSLLLRQDLTTPPQQLELDANEAVIWVPVDTRSTVPSLIEPGDQVSFLVPKSRGGMPTPAGDSEQGGFEPIPERMTPSGPIETVGPFTVLSLGNRLSSPEVFKSARIPLVQENVVGIRVDLDKNGDLLLDAQHLVDLLNATGSYPVGIMLHGRGDAFAGRE